jgi:hypothetical protein
MKSRSTATPDLFGTFEPPRHPTVVRWEAELAKLPVGTRSVANIARGEEGLTPPTTISLFAKPPQGPLRPLGRPVLWEEELDDWLRAQKIAVATKEQEALRFSKLLGCYLSSAFLHCGAPLVDAALVELVTKRKDLPEAAKALRGLSNSPLPEPNASSLSHVAAALTKLAAAVRQVATTQKGALASLDAAIARYSASRTWRPGALR